MKKLTDIKILKSNKSIAKKLYKSFRDESGFFDTALITGFFAGVYFLGYQMLKAFHQGNQWVEFDCESKCKLPIILAECEHGGKSPYNMRYIRYDLEKKVEGSELIKIIEDSVKEIKGYDFSVKDDYIFEWPDKKRVDDLKYIEITKKNDPIDNLAGIAYLCSLVGIPDGLKVFRDKGYNLIIDEKKEHDSLTFELCGYGFRDYGFLSPRFFKRNQKDFEIILEKINKKLECNN